MRDYRSIPLEVLRDFARAQSEVTSIRACADEIGVGRSTFHLFVQGKRNPQRRILRLLGLWYLERANEAHDIDVVRPYAAALSVLLSGVPVPEQEAASVELVSSLERIYAGRAERPRWLDLLSEVKR